jgi:hypothetical protein
MIVPLKKEGIPGCLMRSWPEQATVDPIVIQLIRRAVIVILLRPVLLLYICVWSIITRRGSIWC